MLSSGASHGKTIVGYYASWQWYDRYELSRIYVLQANIILTLVVCFRNKLAAPENMDFTKVQRVNYAFFQTDTSTYHVISSLSIIYFL